MKSPISYTVYSNRRIFLITKIGWRCHIYHVEVVHRVQPDQLVLLDQVVEDGKDAVQEVDEQLRVRTFGEDLVEAVNLDDGQSGARFLLSPEFERKQI